MKINILTKKSIKIDLDSLDIPIVSPAQRSISKGENPNSLAFIINDKIYNTSNPFDFMDMINLQGKTNFFEKRVGEYQKAGVLNNENNTTFSLDSDF